MDVLNAPTTKKVLPFIHLKSGCVTHLNAQLLTSITAEGHSQLPQEVLQCSLMHENKPQLLHLKGCHLEFKHHCTSYTAI